MNVNQDLGLLERTRELVNEILPTLPLTSEVTDDVLSAIENTPHWRVRFDGLCVEHNPGTVCQRVGQAVSEALSSPEHISRCRKPRNGLCGSYTRLHVP